LETLITVRFSKLFLTKRAWDGKCFPPMQTE